MIISHKHKYLFVELPMTGSTAISKELREQYDGVSILQKHSTYHDFSRFASEEEKRYFIFAGIRHPLDQVVSHYFKFKTGHSGQFTSDYHVAKLKKSLRFRLAYTYSHLRRYQFIQENDADFGTFFLKFYKTPYNSWSSMDHARFDYVIRFEQLTDDFAEVVGQIGLELKRPLPQKNKTADKESDFFSYYNTPEVRERAMRVFGPYMKQWGYEFPTAWGPGAISWRTRTEFTLLNFFRNGYWKYFRHPAVAVKDSMSVEEARRLALDEG